MFLRRGVFMENPFPTAIHDGRSRRPWLPIEPLVGGKSGQRRGRGHTSALCVLPIAWRVRTGFGAIDALWSNRRAFGCNRRALLQLTSVRGCQSTCPGGCRWAGFGSCVHACFDLQPSGASACTRVCINTDTVADRSLPFPAPTLANPKG